MAPMRLSHALSGGLRAPVLSMPAIGSSVSIATGRRLAWTATPPCSARPAAPVVLAQARKAERHRRQQRQQQQEQQAELQQLAAARRQLAGSASAATSSSSLAPLQQPQSQTIDLSTATSFEVRGNQVILTLGSRDDSDGNVSDSLASGSLEQGVAPMQQDQVMDAVVKVYCTHTEPHMSLPWQRKRQYASTSSGFAVQDQDGQRFLLTNAHSVEYHSQVKVKRRGDDRKFLATVKSVGTECDIALLSVEDPEFWQGVNTVRFGSLPTLQDSVFVVGYPIGGDTISVTSGVVSRIEVTAYAHGATELLGVQIDAAINSGNSGGPVFNEYGECVGIAFQSYAGSDAENIGWIIPTPVIDHFLTDYRTTGTFTGFPALGVQWQRMESEALRAACGMGDTQKGVLVRSVQPCSKAAGVLQAGDVLLAFDGVDIACDGTVPFLSGERIAFSYLTSQKFTSDVAKLDVLREGQPLRFEIPLMRPSPLVPHHLNGGDPSYLVVAGIVFTVVTEPYLESEYGADYHREAPVKLLDKLLYTDRQFEDEQVVILSQVLACDTTLGYEEMFNLQVLKFNGEAVRNLRHLAEMVLSCTDRFMRFELSYHEILVIETAKVAAATEEIIRLQSIPSMVSRDLGDLLEKHGLSSSGSGALAAAAAAVEPEHQQHQQQQPVAAAAGAAA